MHLAELWAKTKNWLRLFVAWNIKRYALWLAAAIASTVPVVVKNCTREEGAPAEVVPDLPPLPAPDLPPWPTGWVPPTESEIKQTLDSLEYRTFADTPAGRAEKAELIGADGDAFAWQLAARGRARLGRPQIGLRDQRDIGSCVAFGSVDACEHAMASAVALGKSSQELPDLAQEVVYGAGRVNIHPRPPLGRNQDGMMGAWAARALTTVGLVARGNAAGVDLSEYSVPRCRDYGATGVPAPLLPVAKSALANSVTLCRTTDELDKALAQGYFAFVCSRVGFGDINGRGPLTRDADGFLREDPRYPWGHCMSVIGRKGGARPGYLIKNSWSPSWVQGPKGGVGIPEGCFWVTPATVQKMLDEVGPSGPMPDSYIVSGVKGFPRRRLTREDWIAEAPPGPRFFTGWIDPRTLGGINAIR